MSPKTFSLTAAMVFLLVAVVHVLRLVYGWGAVIGGWTVPMWISWVGLVVAAFLSYHGFRLAR